jgi:hypothetical protein
MTRIRPQDPHAPSGRLRPAEIVGVDQVVLCHAARMPVGDAQGERI